jgi:hypothetical protein
VKANVAAEHRMAMQVGKEGDTRCEERKGRRDEERRGRRCEERRGRRDDEKREGGRGHRVYSVVEWFVACGVACETTMYVPHIIYGASFLLLSVSPRVSLLVQEAMDGVMKERDGLAGYDEAHEALDMWWCCVWGVSSRV